MRMFPYSPINYSVAAPYDVRCAFDEEHHEWIYVISMPEKDKAMLEEICKAYNIKAEDLIRQFYLWVIREPEAAAQWLKGEKMKAQSLRLNIPVQISTVLRILDTTGMDLDIAYSSKFLVTRETHHSSYKRTVQNFVSNEILYTNFALYEIEIL